MPQWQLRGPSTQPPILTPYSQCILWHLSNWDLKHLWEQKQQPMLPGPTFITFHSITPTSSLISRMRSPPLEGTRCWRQRGRAYWSFSPMSSPVTPRLLPFSSTRSPCNRLRGSSRVILLVPSSFAWQPTPSSHTWNRNSGCFISMMVQSEEPRLRCYRIFSSLNVRQPNEVCISTTQRQNWFARIRRVACCWKWPLTCVKWTQRRHSSLAPPLVGWLSSIHQSRVGYMPLRPWVPGCITFTSRMLYCCSDNCSLSLRSCISSELPHAAFHGSRLSGA